MSDSSGLVGPSGVAATNKSVDGKTTKRKLDNKSIFMKHPIKLVESPSLINTDPIWSSFTGLNTASIRPVWQVIKRCCKENFVARDDGGRNQKGRLYLPLTKAVLDVLNTVKG